MLAIVGLGNIGLAMGRRLALREQQVMGIDLADERRTAWTVATGLTAVDHLEHVNWQDITHVFVIVRMTDQAAAVLQDLRRLCHDTLVVFLVTTLELPFARELELHTTPSMRLIELPVSGGESGAMAGALTVMAAGPLEDKDERLLTDTVAAHVVRFSQYGEPTLAKLLNNVTAAYNARALAEMLLLSDSLNLDAHQFYQVLLTSSGSSWVAHGLFDLVDELLGKDVELLRSQVGALPEVSLPSDGSLPDRLTQARTLLSSAVVAQAEAGATAPVDRPGGRERARGSDTSPHAAST